jgi:hypothetical protein
MQPAQMIRHVLCRLEARPSWLKWLEAAPPPVREADARLRREYRWRVLVALLCAGAFGLLKTGHGVAALPMAALWLPFIGLAALAWPLAPLRLALAAHHGARAGGVFAVRLRWLSLGLFLLGIVSAIALVALAVPLLWLTGVRFALG